MLVVREKAASLKGTPNSEKSGLLLVSPFILPTSEYQQPSSEYQQPSSEYQLPNREYQQPNREYQQPNREYQQPTSSTNGPYLSPFNSTYRPQYNGIEGSPSTSTGCYNKNPSFPTSNDMNFNVSPYFWTEEAVNRPTLTSNQKRLTSNQIQVLQDTFLKDIFPAKHTRETLSKKLELNANCVDDSFKKCRQTLLKHMRSRIPPPTRSADINLAGLKKCRGNYFTNEQRNILLQSFKHNRHPTKKRKQHLASMFGMKCMYINRWFNNRNQRIKREESGSPPVVRALTKFSNAQKIVLMEAFAKNYNPNLLTRKGLANRLGIPTKVVTSWFDNRRYRYDKNGLLKR